MIHYCKAVSYEYTRHLDYVQSVAAQLMEIYIYTENEKNE